ncbi:MAG TPA: SpoIIE family protein phosphatase [Acidimicrobiales bacterium]
MAARGYAFGAPTLNDLMLALTSAGTIADVAAATLRIGAAIVDARSARLAVVVQPGWCRDFVAPSVSDGHDTVISSDRPIEPDRPSWRSTGWSREPVFDDHEEFRAAFPHLAGDHEPVDANTAITLLLPRSDGTVIGALTFGFDEPGPIAIVRRSLARQVSEQCSLALERSLLLHREREAAGRALRLQSIATRLAGVVHASDLAVVIGDACRDAVGAARCAVYLLDPDGWMRRVAARRPAGSHAAEATGAATDRSELPDELAPGMTSPVGDALALGHLIAVESEAQFHASYGDSVWPPCPSLITVPLRVGHTTLGVFCAEYDSPRRCTPDDRSFIGALAEQIAIAVERIRLNQRAETQTAIAERERDRWMAITSSLQDGLFTTDTDGRILEVNDRFCEIVGFPREQAIWTVPPYPWWPRPNNASSKRFLEALRARIARGDNDVNEFDVTLQQPDGRRVLGLLTIASLHGADGRLVGTVGTIKDVTGRVLAERRLRALQTVTARLAAARTIDDVARVAVDVAVPALRAAGGAFFIRHDGGWQLLMHSADPRAPVTWRQPDVDVDDTTADALRKGNIVVTDAELTTGETVGHDAPAGSRVVHVPVCLHEGGDVVACFSMLFLDDRPPAREDFALYTAIAQQCGPAIERALTSEAEHQARLAAERSDTRTRLLQQLTAALTIASEPLDVARALREHVAEMFGTDGFALFAVAEQERELVMVDASPDPTHPLVLRVLRLPLDGDYALSEAARTQRAVWVNNHDEWRATFPAHRRPPGAEYGGAIVLPLVVEQRSLGLLVLIWRDALTLGDDERAMLVTIADLAAHALDRADRYATERAVASTLQQSLLPRAVQGTDRCAVAVRYQPALDQLQVGGDWYDTMRIDDDRLTITVGDVVGRGLAAAACMGQLRSALGALALQGGDPTDVLERLDGFARRIDGGESATVAFAVLDTDTGTMRYACAGHPPPLLVEPGAPPRFLEGGRSWPVGIDYRGARRSEANVRLKPASVVVFYTDGLVERRHVTLDEQLEALARLASTIPADDPGRLCDGLLDGMLDDAPSDDVAVLAVLYEPALAERLHWRFAADTANVPLVRRTVRRWLHRHGIVGDDAHDIVLAIDEACSNAVRHGSAGPHTDVVLDAHVDGDRVVATVSDTRTGTGRDTYTTGGHGIVLMNALMSSVEIEVTPTSTRVHLTRPARVHDREAAAAS